MKRKRGSVKRKPKKPSVTATARDPVDPGYYSDINENDRIDTRTQIQTREASTRMSGWSVGLDEPVMNNETVGSAAAKLARAISSSCTIPTSDKGALLHERIGEKEPKSSHRYPVYNKQELDAAKSVIKRIMKMDAAVPFNMPVDPMALGIPDYFDIIDTPMDFGTIRSKLENGLKYRNSEEVFKDVQLIWDNCCKYNKKGSYILELMKRVKKHFMKQWTAAGLYKERQTVNNGHVQHNLQLFAESIMRHEEAARTHPAGTTICRSAYLPQHDLTLLNQRQCQHFSSCCSQSPQIANQCQYLHSGQSQLGQHQHDLAPQHNHHMHLHSGDLMNGKCCNQWVNEASPSQVHSCQPSPSSLIGHPKQRGCMHNSISSQLPPSQLQADINTHSSGHLHLPRREPTLNSNKHNHAFNSDGLSSHAGPPNQMDSVHMQAYHPSACCTPVHQVNCSTCHQLQSSHVEGGRNNGFVGDLDIPPPTESTANCTKHGTECPQPRTTDDTSCQEPNQINLTPDRSSSMINIEASQPLENTCQNQPESRPSQRLHSTADNNFSKRRTRSQGLTQCQEPSLSMMNSQKHLPQENTCQVQTGSPQSQPSPPTADQKKRKSKSQGREPTAFREGERVPITTNEQGHPIGPQAPKLVSFLGKLARNGHFLPLTYRDWRAMPFENKENMWEKVQSMFDIDPICKHWVLQSLSLRWKGWKSKLKTAHYYPHETDEERLADRDERVLPDQWAALIKLWSTESAQIGSSDKYASPQKSSAINRANRMRHKFVHAAGRKTFADIREELRAKSSDGKEPSRAELFILTRTCKNGKPVNEASSKVIAQLRQQINGQDTPQDSNEQGDVLTEILGRDKKGRTRCIELGPSPSDFGGEKPTCARSTTMVSDGNAEIHEMKEKMAVMEQTCAQMASQMETMMAMMSTMFRNLPDKVVPDMSVASGPHPVPQEVGTQPSTGAASTRQTRRSRRNTANILEHS